MVLAKRLVLNADSGNGGYGQPVDDGPPKDVPNRIIRNAGERGGSLYGQADLVDIDLEPIRVQS